jgi:hypothetical protein
VFYGASLLTGKRIFAILLHAILLDSEPTGIRRRWFTAADKSKLRPAILI